MLVQLSGSSYPMPRKPFESLAARRTDLQSQRRPPTALREVRAPRLCRLGQVELRFGRPPHRAPLAIEARHPVAAPDGRSGVPVSRAWPGKGWKWGVFLKLHKQTSRFEQLSEMEKRML